MVTDYVELFFSFFLEMRDLDKLKSKLEIIMEKKHGYM